MERRTGMVVLYSICVIINITQVLDMKHILILLSILLMCGNASGATYYLSASGDNSGSSTGCATAMDMSDFNGASFNAGDIINVCDDDGVFRSTMTVPSSGTSGSPITIQATSGDSPIINGADIITTWELATDDVWYSVLGTTPYIVMFDDDEVGSNHTPYTAGVLLIENDWAQNTSALYIFSEQDPDASSTYAATVEAAQRNKCVDMNGKDYLTFDGIRFENVNSINIPSYGYGGGISAYASASTNIIIQNCEFYYTMVAISCRHEDGDYWTIDNNTFVGLSDAYGLFVRDADNITITDNTFSRFQQPVSLYEGCNDIIFTGNTMFDWGYRSPSAGSTDAMGMYISSTGDNFVVSDNLMYDPAINYDGYELAWKGDPTNILIDSNTYLNSKATGDSGLVVDMHSNGRAIIINNYIENAHCYGMFVLGGDGHTIYGNTLKNCASGCYGGTGYQHGIIIRTDNWDGGDRVATNHVVTRNIVDGGYRGLSVVENTAGETGDGIKFYNNTVNGISGEANYYTFGTNQNLELKNNIFSGSTATYFAKVVADSITGWDSDYNLFYGSSEWLWAADGTDTTLADWQAGSSQDAHSIEADPLFKDPANGDFHTLSSSPIRNAGIDVRHHTGGHDFDGHRIKGTRPDIGAYEHRKDEILILY